MRPWALHFELSLVEILLTSAEMRAIWLFPVLLFATLNGGPTAVAAASPSLAKCEAQFHTTPPVSIVESHRLRMSLVKSTLAMPNSEYIANLEKVAAAVRGLRVKKSLTEKVLYPFSGYDLTAPLVLFPKAKHIILIDRNSAIEPFELQNLLATKQVFVGSDRNRDWMFWKQTGRDVFRQLILSIFSVSPNSKLNRIDFYRDSNDDVSVEIRFTDGRDGELKRVSYWVGQLTDLPVEMRNQVAHDQNRTYWWDKELSEIRPQTLLIKGSHSLLRITRYPDSSRRQRLLTPILEGGGLIVEGASKQSTEQDLDWAKSRKSGLSAKRPLWELTDGDKSFPEPTRRIELEGTPFSYSDRVRVSLYPPRR